MSDIAIRVQNLSKQYKIGATIRHDRLKDLLTSRLNGFFRRSGSSSLCSQPSTLNSLPSDHIWALKELSFEVKQGEVLGIIGPNGAGKSTLLKILSRITEPTSGRAEIYGRVGSLLEVGTGFDRELTGRENIYLNAAVLGMKKGEIDRKFDEIVSFSEVERFIDTPVKRYSSGMFVRLAFAVAAHLEPQILIIDEVLSVGDVAFQKKCLGKMGDVVKEGRTVLFVSHNLGAILQNCNRAILLVNGARVFDGDAPAAVSKYLSEEQSTHNVVCFDDQPHRDAQITSMSVVSPDSRVISAHPHTHPLCVLLNYRVKHWTTGTYVCFDVFNEADIRLLWSSDVASIDDMLIERPPGAYQARITIPGMVLSPGRYYFTGAIYAPGSGIAFDVREKAISIKITDGGSLLSNFGIKPHAATMIPLSWKTSRLG